MCSIRLTKTVFMTGVVARWTAVSDRPYCPWVKGLATAFYNALTHAPIERGFPTRVVHVSWSASSGQTLILMLCTRTHLIACNRQIVQMVTAIARINFAAMRSTPVSMTVVLPATIIVIKFQIASGHVSTLTVVSNVLITAPAKHNGPLMIF